MNSIEPVRGVFQWWTHLFRIDAGLWPQVETSVRLGLQSTATLACCLDIESGGWRGDDLSSAAFDWLCAPAALHCRYLKLIECNIREMGQRDDKWVSLVRLFRTHCRHYPSCSSPAGLTGWLRWMISIFRDCSGHRSLSYVQQHEPFFPRKMLFFFCQQILALGDSENLKVTNTVLPAQMKALLSTS